MIFCNIYRDLTHFVAKPVIPNGSRQREVKPKTGFDFLFKIKYYEYIRQGFKNDEKGREELYKRLCWDLHQEFDKEDYDFLKGKVRHKLNNCAKAELARHQRLSRKASLFKEYWTHFITITWSDKIFKNEDDFEKTLKSFFARMKNRYGWIVSGKFEYGKEGRLHFHGLARILPGTSFSKIELRNEWNYVRRAYENRYANVELDEKFGRTEFEPLSREALQNGNLIDYISKYENKSEGKYYHSRGIPSGFSMMVDENEIDAIKEIEFEYTDKEGEVQKKKKERYVLADEVFRDSRDDVFNIKIFSMRREISTIS